jgi:hypothetical protein
MTEPTMTTLQAALTRHLEGWTSNPTPHNTDADELTAMNLRDAHAATVERIQRRAKYLFRNGYRWERTTVAGLFHVYSPQGAFYILSVGDDLDRCSCPCFRKLGTCKHHLALAAAVREEDARDAAQAAEYDALHTDADDDCYPEL